jgi:CRP/FNR family transcriptional regulator, cyclic AMP receptor protein
MLTPQSNLLADLGEKQGEAPVLTDTELIRKLEFFEPLDQKIIKQITSLCIVREFGAGDAIVRQGESGLGLYFITGGRAKVEVDRDGSKVVVAELKEGDFLGEFAIIDDKTRSASVICLQDTRCLLLTRDSFGKLLKKHPEIGSQMLRTLVNRIRSTNERISQPSGTRLAEPPPTAPVTPADAPASSDNGQGSGGLAAAASQITEMLPKPEELVQLYSSTKGKTQEFLNRFVSAIYAMKAMLRFSMAIVGCPVDVTVESLETGAYQDVLQAELNGVKLVLLPAGSEQTLRIHAYAGGVVSATVFRPRGSEAAPRVEVLRLAGPVQEHDTLRLCLPVERSIEVRLNRGKYSLPVGIAPGAATAGHWQVSDAGWLERR